MKKFIRFFFLLCCAGFVCALIAYFSVRYIATQRAIEKSQDIIEAAEQTNPKNADEELIAITKEVHKRFHAQNPANIGILKLRPILTHPALPSWIRFEEGVFETLLEKGLCDNAARFLHFVLKQKGYDSVQWNMVTNQRAHSILLVNLRDGQNAILDPLLGAIGLDKSAEKFLDPFDIKSRMQQGATVEDVFLFLNPEHADIEFYEDFANVRMGAQGQPLLMNFDLPVTVDSAPLLFGEINGDDQDVYDASAARYMSPFWHFAGHKYDRSWVRSLNIHQNIRLEFILTSPVDDTVLTSDIQPEIAGNKIIWHLKDGDVLTFYDGRAKRSWKRMNSFLPIDQIAVYPE